MSSSPQILNRRGAEILFALITGSIGIAVIKGALEMDIGWASSGPDAGYFPFRVGLVIFCASLVNLVQRGFLSPAQGNYLSRHEFAAMLSFIIPLILLAAASLWLGLYIAITLYLIIALKGFGKVYWLQTLAIAAGTSLFLFVTFEFVFHLPLPKGPLGALFGIP